MAKTSKKTPAKRSGAVEFSFHIEPEDIPVRGNAMASGDDAADRELEDEILARLDRGDDVAWCMAVVTATLEIDGETFKGTASLGACSYETEAQLRNECFEHYDLTSEALADLKATITATVTRGATAAKALKLLQLQIAMAEKLVSP